MEPLEAAGVTILGTSPDAIDIAEDRKRFEALSRELNVTQPANGTAVDVEGALKIAARVGYPVLVRMPRGDPWAGEYPNTAAPDEQAALIYKNLSGYELKELFKNCTF